MTRKIYVGDEKLISGTVFRDVTLNDDVDLPLGPCRGLILGTSGNVSVIGFGDDDPVVLPALVAGVVHPVSVKRIRATGTTATGIVAVY